MASNEIKRSKFSVVTYATINEVRDVVDKIFSEGRIKACAYILHDKDVTEDGERKEPHIHIVLITNQSVTKTAVQNYFKGCVDYKGERANTLVQCQRKCNRDDGTITFEDVDVKGAIFYLVHESQTGVPLTGKYHYQWDDVEGYNVDMLKNWQELIGRKPKEDRTFEILERVIMGDSPYVLAKEYGRDFILNYKKYTDLAYSIHCRDMQDEEFKEQNERLYQEHSRKHYLYDILEDGDVLPTNECIIQEQDRRIHELESLLRKNKIDFKKE